MQLKQLIWRDSKMSQTNDTLMVSKNTHPNQLAGAIAGMIRDGKETSVLAIGPSAVNQGVKGFATATSFMNEENKNLLMSLSYETVKIEEDERTAMRMKAVVQEGNVDVDREYTVLKVSSKTHPNKLAGAIAGMLREGKNVAVHGIGAPSVNQAIKSFATATNFLKEENIELYVQPHYSSVMFEGKEGEGQVERTSLMLYASVNKGN